MAAQKKVWKREDGQPRPDYLRVRRPTNRRRCKHGRIQLGVDVHKTIVAKIDAQID